MTPRRVVRADPAPGGSIVSFPFDAGMNAVVRDRLRGTWIPSARAWKVPADPAAVRDVFAAWEAEREAADIEREAIAARRSLMEKQRRHSLAWLTALPWSHGADGAHVLPLPGRVVAVYRRDGARQLIVYDVADAGTAGGILRRHVLRAGRGVVHDAPADVTEAVRRLRALSMAEAEIGRPDPLRLARVSHTPALVFAVRPTDAP